MSTILIEQLKMLELKHKPQKQENRSRLRVYYGWAKLGKIRKREAISIIYENEEGVAEHHRMGKVLQKAQHTVFWRYQSDEEAQDAKHVNRVFTEYSVFMDDKKIRGSLEAAIRQNSLYDQKNVSLAERTKIANALRQWYMSEHRGYKEPVRQLELHFM